MSMKYVTYFIIIIFISSCSICRMRTIRPTEHIEIFLVYCWRINPSCPEGSTVDGYNPQGILFRVNAFNTITREQNVYTFYKDSEVVTKQILYNTGINSYKMTQENDFTDSLSYIDKYVFQKIVKISDSLHLKSFDFLSNGKGFILRQSHVMGEK
jgi:hypothetical protein